MFRPIKNFITYIQRNAGSSSIFGGGAPVADADVVEVDQINELTENKKKEELNEKEIMESNADIDPILFETDLEQHIKSCVIPLKNGRIIENHDHNHNHSQSHSQTENGGVDNFFVVENGDTLDDVIIIEPKVTLQQPEVPAATPFPDPEIIVIPDDLNSSLNSEAPSEDPLAIDDFNVVVAEANSLLDTNSSQNWIEIGMITESDSPIDITKDNHGLSVDEQPCLVLNLEPAKEAPDHITKCVANAEPNEELRGEGSDSGLGSEMSTLQTTITSLTDLSHSSHVVNVITTPPTLDVIDIVVSKDTHTPNQLVSTSLANIPSTSTTSRLLVRKPLRSNLKRRLEDSLDSPTYSCELTTVQKKPKRSINFDSVQVFYFPRQQGFGCVPSAGGCTLGMGAQHISTKTLSLAEHAAEIRRAHRLQLQEINPRGSSSEDTEESEEDYLSEGSGSDLDTDLNGFLQPVSPKQRRAILKAAGVRKIDASEKAECRDIRNSREVCGCTCRDFCDPETCSCNLAGIKCQVDRAMFPCGCSRDACGNSVGRVEFNPTRVRTHYIHTIMRLEMENRQQQNPLCSNSVSSISYSISGTTTNSTSPLSSGDSHALEHGIGTSSGVATANATTNYYGMQSQSNYSSGYASPAYGCEQTTSYYQQQSSSDTHYASPDLGSTSQYPLPLDSLDSALFNGAPSATPAYAEIMPNYASSSTTYHNLSYSSLNSNHQTQISVYSSFSHQTSSASFHGSAPAHVTITPAYSSCAVPSAPPFGAATTTAATAQYLSPVLDTTVNSCSSLDTDASNFISLNTPISSSSRFSQINDLLQHNRNTTAALVAVSQSIDELPSISSPSEVASINTPPIQEVQRKCLEFEQPPASPLKPAPIVAVIEKIDLVKSLPSEPPPQLSSSSLVSESSETTISSNNLVTH